MADDNRPIKYARYAIGEIVLVVIGILIALQINTWNQERNENKLARDYLVRIKRDISQDTLNFRKIIKFNDSLRGEIKNLLVFIYDDIDDPQKVIDICSTYDVALDQVFSPNDNTYKGMISSGSLNLIREIELREAIMQLYSDYDKKHALFQSNKEWLDGLAVIVDTKTDLIKFSPDVYDIYIQPDMLNESDYSFLNDPDDERFKIVVRGISATAWNQKVSNEYYSELIEKGGQVLAQLDRALN